MMNFSLPAQNGNENASKKEKLCFLEPKTLNNSSIFGIELTAGGEPVTITNDFIL